MARPPAPHDVLAAALRDTGAALSRRSLAFAAQASDSLRLALPPVAAIEVAPAQVLAAYAALYLHAELDEAGVLPVVEMLAEQRRSLALRDVATAERLERFARGLHENPSRAERSLLYGRLFGIGPGAERLDFMPRLLRLATSIARADADRVRGGSGLASQAAWWAAAQALLALAAAESAGTLVVRARRVHARTLAAFEVLGDRGLQRQLGTQSPWQTLQRLLAGDAAARDAAARRGAAGQTLLQGLASQAAWPDAASVQAAVRWMVACGLPAGVVEGNPLQAAMVQPSAARSDRVPT